MVRTQIQLTEHQASELKRISASRGESMAALIRKSVDQLVERERMQWPAEVVARAKQAAGRYRSGSKDISANHDRYLVEAIAKR